MEIEEQTELSPLGELQPRRRHTRRAGPLKRSHRRVRAFAVGHPIVLVGLFLAALDLLLVYPAVLGGRVLGPEDFLFFNAPLSAIRPGSLLHPSNYLLTDALEVFHPDLEWARGMVRSGQLPLWNPQIFGGWPQFASQQTAMLYPLNWLVYVLPFWPALSLIVVLKALVAGLGTWWLCRRLGLGMAAALLAAVTYSLSSYFVIWLEHPHSNVYTLIPWLLGAIQLVCARRRITDAAILAAVVGLCFLGGHPESTFIAALAAVPFAVLCLTGLPSAGERRRGLLLLTGAVGLGVAGGAVMLIPFAEIAAQAPQLARGGGSGQPDESLLALILPDLWGRPDSPFQLVGQPSNYAERATFVGALPLMLAVAGLCRLRDRTQRFFLGMVIGGLILAIHVPSLTEAIVDLPVLSYVALNRALILVALGLAILAAYGLQRFLEADPGQRRLMLALSAAIGCLPLLWLTRHAAAFHELPRFTDIAPHLWGKSTTQAQTAAAAVTRWLAFSLAALAILWLLQSRRRGRPRRTALGLTLAVALAAADLLALNHGYHPAIPEEQAAPAPTPSLVAARAGQGTGRTLGYNEYLIPNVGSRYGLREPTGHGLPALGRYLDLWHGLGGFGFMDTRLRPKDPRAGQLLDDFGVALLLTSRNEYPPSLSGLDFVARNADGKIYRNASALPRAYLATSWRPAASRQTALTATVASTTAGLRAAPIIEGVKSSPAPVTPPAGGGGVSFAKDDANTVALDVAAPHGGYLVLLDTYYPGWRATVDGHAASIHPANEAFRAVAVPAGRHRVEFRYRPTGLVAAAALSGVAWIVILALIAAPRIRRGRAPIPAARAAARRRR